MMSMQEFIHNTDHARMGCGPMNCCELCNNSFGATETTQKEPLITSRELLKYLIMVSVSTVFVELVVKKKLLKK